MCSYKQPTPPTENSLSCATTIGESIAASSVCQLRADELPIPKHELNPWHGDLVGDSTCFPCTAVAAVLTIVTRRRRFRNGFQPAQPTNVRSQREKYQHVNAIVGDSASNQDRRKC